MNLDIGERFCYDRYMCVRSIRDVVNQIGKNLF